MGDERDFFDLFEQAAGNVVRAAALLETMLDQWPDRAELGSEVVDCEHEGDRITLAIIQRLNATSVTPIHGDDIHALATALDDIVDYIEEVASFLALYRIEAPMLQAQTLAQILHRAAQAVAGAVPCLRSFEDIRGYTEEINGLENEGDACLREALASLFETGIDPMLVIRWKDIFERLEDAIDAADATAHLLDGIVARGGRARGSRRRR